jgi:predicted CxxxxCH...CXXCH cytochrome family protein
VYCHSAPTFTAATVPTPTVDFAFTGYPATYPAYTVTSGRAYQSVTWGSAALGCGACHGFPIRPSSTTDAAMVGQSHSWLDTASGNEGGHGWNHGFSPLSCRTCHSQTVTQANATSRAAGLSVYGAVPVANFALHVNGKADVVFDTVNALPYSTPRTLTGATYNATNKTCANVSCHLAQTQVTSGAPYRPGNAVECDVCHQY